MASSEAKNPSPGGIACRWISVGGRSSHPGEPECRRCRARPARRPRPSRRPRPRSAGSRPDVDRTRRAGVPGRDRCRGRGSVTQGLPEPGRRSEVGQRRERRHEEAASATPRSSRSATTASRRVREGDSASARAAINAPPSRSGRRPQVSLNRPANGRRTSAVIANAPNASPAPASFEPSGPVTQSGRRRPPPRRGEVGEVGEDEPDERAVSSRPSRSA